MLLVGTILSQSDKRVPTEYLTIQEAIDSALDGDVILVAAGTYVENINFYGRNIVVQSEDGPLSTIITPANIGVSIVWFHSGETTDAKLIGFTLRDGGISSTNVGALKFDGRSNPTVENCIITNCAGNLISYYYSGAVLKNCLIYDNVENCQIFYFGPSDYHPDIINCTIANNSDWPRSLVGFPYAPKFKNCVIYGNNVGIRGNVDISYSLVEGGFLGTGNIDADPLFVDASNYDYHLQANSPCIDTGTNFEAPSSDIDGMPRPKGVWYDMGAYEAYLPIVLISYTPDPTNDNTPTLDWWDVDGASIYTLQYSDQSDFSIHTEVTDIAESVHEITDALSDGVWYWRVRALDSEGLAGWWTMVDSFVVDAICTLTIFASAGGTTTPSLGSYTYDYGMQVSIIATPDSNYRFSDWTGNVPDGHENDNPITITMDSDKSVTANFEAIPLPPKPSDEDGKKGGCFIATAAYGSSLHPHIDILREFRDKHLMTNRFGRVLVNLYYKYSPPIAKLIARNKVLKIIAQSTLHPLICLSYLMIH